MLAFAVAGPGSFPKSHTEAVNDVPPAEIETPPIVIRRYLGDEAPALVEAVTASVDHLMPWMPWASAEPLKPALEAFVARSVDEFDRGENFNYAIWSSGQSTLVGGSGLHPRLGPGRIEIGYWVRDGMLRRGVATRVARALTIAAFGLPEIDEVHIHCDEANVASAAVPRRLGFRLIRTLADEVTAPGEIGRSMEWVTTRVEWDESAQGS